jgi:hypothetical protein
MKKEIRMLKRSECDYWFYAESGVYGMFCTNVRNYFFCIPYVIGFRYSIEWGNR